MVGGTKIMSPRNGAGTAEVAPAGASSADWAARQAAAQIVTPGGGRVSAEQ